MRSTLVLAASSVLLAALMGCDSKGTAPSTTPSPTAAPKPTQEAAPVADRAAPSGVVRVPAMVVFAGREGSTRTVGAVIEDGGKPSVALSAAGVDTTFASAISARRALLVEHAEGGSIAGLVAVRATDGSRADLGRLPAGQYHAVEKTLEVGGAIVVELSRAERAGNAAHDVMVLRPGAEPKLLAATAKLAAAAGERIAIVVKGNLSSVKLDGTGSIALGGGDGHDEVVEARGDRILLTTHAGPGGDVRLARIDGGAVDLGTPGAEEKAVAITESSRVVYLRKTAGGAVLVSAGLDGTGESVLTAPELDARPFHVAGDQIFFGGAGGALRAVSATQGAPIVLDPAAGKNVRVGAIGGGRIVYASDTPQWPALRAAALDGSGVTSLVEEPPAIPFFSGLMPDGRVVYYRALAGQIDGGRMFSVKLDGSDRRPIGTAVTGTDGKPMPAGPLDQDFEVITPSGRVILESEFEASGGSQLLVGAADKAAATILPGASHVRFTALIE